MDDQNTNNMSDGNGAEFQVWNPEIVLPSLGDRTGRYVNALCQLNLAELFSDADTYWSSFFQVCGATLANLHFEVSTEIPKSFHRHMTFLINEEMTTLGYSQDTTEAILQTIIPNFSGVGRPYLLEYLERRLIATLAKSWKGDTKFDLSYATELNPRTVPITMGLRMTLELDGQTLEFWYGLGERIVQTLEVLAREKLHGGEPDFPWLREPGAQEATFQISVELAQMAIEPTVLIDYLRPDSVIDLEIPLPKEVLLRCNGNNWMTAQLCHANHRFAGRIIGRREEEASFPASATRVIVELAYLEVDWEMVREYSHEGSVIPIGVPLETPASIVISGESVAQAVIGQIHGRFALKILPK